MMTEERRDLLCAALLYAAFTAFVAAFACAFAIVVLLVTCVAGLAGWDAMGRVAEAFLICDLVGSAFAGLYVWRLYELDRRCDG